MEPGYHFWTGASYNMMPDKEGTLVANEKARFDDLQMYSGQDVIITLPKSMTIFDVNYLAIYNEDIQDNLGHISFNVSANRIPPALGQTKKPGWWFEMPIKPVNPSQRTDE